MNPRFRNTLSSASALFVAALLTLSLSLSQPACANSDDPPGRVARIRFLQGSVSFQPAGESEWVAAVANRPMTTGDRLWVDAGSRAEVQIGSAVIRVDASTGFSFLNLDDRTVQIQLSEGTLGLRVRRLRSDEILEVDTPNEAFSVTRPGQYRVSAGADGNSSSAVVREGAGEATGGGQTYTVSAGQRGTFSGTDALYGEVVNAGGYDDFDNWGRSRDVQYDGSRSARYVSSDVVGYEDLDSNGVWRSDHSYGDVWVPTSVPKGWAPYRYGHWEWISPWGWTWVDDSSWGFAPFHYGRWVSTQGSWCWVPGPRTVEPVYAPALVAFIGGPSFGVSIGMGGGSVGGNVGWFPLGPREVYVPAYNTSREYVNRINVSNTTVNTTTITNVYNNQVTNNVTNTNVTYVNRTVPGAVTAVPQNAFRTAQPVAKAAVAVNPQQVAAAPVVARAAVTPTPNSVLGKSASTANNVARPPAALVNRPVVAKTTPPPPPVPFAKQQQALAAHPGQPLAPHEVQSLHPANMATASLVKLAPPGKPTAPNTHPVGQPVAAKPGQPATLPPASAKVNPPATTQPPPATRADRPPSAQPNNPPPPANQPATANRGQQPIPQPAAKTPVNPPPANAKVNPPATQPPPAAQTSRPSSAQPQLQSKAQPAQPAAKPQTPAEKARDEKKKPEEQPPK